MLRLRCTTLLLFAVVLAGCSRPGLLLDLRGSGSTSPELTSMVERYGQLADRLQAHAAFYEYEVRKNHTKMRLMGVLSVVGAGSAAGLTASAFNPDMPDAVRPAIASASISLSVLSAVFVLLPHAHQYILKEAGYQRMAEATRASYADLENQCGVAVAPDDVAALRACVEAAQDALLAARRFPLDSPCKPPPDRDLDGLLRSAGRAE
ncbi:MAG: hypothetical protein KDA24_14075 [Deltaproteobacteria bacterium]|nr:hypothetical protein [Deltaproteobacteria bacterium]